MPNTVIKLKRSGTVSNAPVALEFGELAINYADGYLYYKAANGTVVRFASGGGDSFGTVNANGTLVVADAPADILTLVPGNNITVVGDAVNDRITVGLSNSININGTATFTGPFTINNGSGAGGSDEGGEIQLANATTNSVLSGPVAIDIWQNRIRFFEVNSPNRGAFINLASAAVGVGTDLLAGGGGTTDTVARSAAGAAFDKANAALANTNGITFGGTLIVSQNLSADKVISTNNGQGENFQVGDDAWIGDTNIADTIRIKGQQNSANAFIAFGNNDGVLLGRAGSGNLTYGGNTVWHSGIDGAGSGLDADLLDGQQGTYYATATDSTAAFGRANIAVANVNYVNTAMQAAFAQANNTGPGTNTYLLTVIAGANTAVGTGANAFTSATLAGANTAVGAGANAFATTAAAGANAFMILVQNGSNTAVGTGANTFATTAAAGANNYLLATIAGANTAVGTGANAYAATIGTASNTYLLTTLAGANTVVGTGANTFATAAAAGANAYLLATIAGANTAVGAGANAFTSATIAGANTAVGAGANAFATAAAAGANNYLLATIAGANTAVGTGANAFATTAAAGANAFMISVQNGSNTAVGLGANNYANSTFVRLTAASQTITGDLAIVGNLTFSGNTTFSNVQSLAVTDPLIYLATNNTSDIVDIGFFGQYSNGTANVHTGLYREHVDKMYYLFQGYDKLPDNNHIGALSNNMTLAVLNADLRTSNLSLAGANAITWITASFAKANTFDNVYTTIAGANTTVGTGANTYLLATLAGANTAVGAGANTYLLTTLAGANTAVGAGANAFATAAAAGANAFTSATIAGANAAVGTGANTYLLTTLAGANTAVGAGANNYLLTTIAGANVAVGTGANSFATDATAGANTYLLTTLAGANTAVGTGANTYLLTTLAGANTAVGTGANTYLLATIAGANTAVGTGANTVGSAAFIQANAAVISANLDSVNTTRFIVFEDAVTGTFNRANLSFGLTYNPSSNTLNTANLVVTDNVGIGRSNPGFKLDVVGTINASNVLINGAPISAGGGGGGATILTDTVNASRFVTFANNTTGTFSQANVASSLTFNPSTGTLSATIFNSTSDVNSKQNIKTIENGLNIINSLRGVSFDWKDTGKPSYGLIAQEVEQHVPALVDTDENGKKSLNYDAVIGFLVEAVKELSKDRNV